MNAEQGYFDQFVGDDPEPYQAMHYTVMNYFRRFAVFETTDRDEALQVAQWETGINPPADDLPEDRIVEHMEWVNGKYRTAGFLWLSDKPGKYREQLDALMAAQHA